MVNYDLITNAELRLLVTASESIHSLPEEQIQLMVQRMAATPADGQKELIAALVDEQNQIKAVKLARGITPEVEQRKVLEASVKMAAVTKKLDAEVRVEHEKNDRSESDAAANALIQELDPPATPHETTKTL